MRRISSSTDWPGPYSILTVGPHAVLTIPKVLRAAVGCVPGDRLEVTVSEGQIELRPSSPATKTGNQAAVPRCR